jgi:glycosyltransferase involved in cell wall biosynthesis
VENIIDGIVVHTLPYMNIPRIRIIKHGSYLKLLTREGFAPDIIITHGFLNISIGDRLSTILSVPHIVGVHSSCLPNIHHFSDIFSRADRIACRSFAIKRRFLEKSPEFGYKVFIANSGIDKDKILEKTDFIRKSYLIDNATFKVISVCNLISRKNIDIVLRALSTLSSINNWHYTIIGDGPERASLEDLAKSLAIDDKVTFMGYIENSHVYKYLDESNVFAMVSSTETFGLAYLEAMARGNIVIGTKGWGIDGIVIDGENGYLCEEISVDNLLNKIMKLMAMSSSEHEKMLNNIYMTINDYTDEAMSQVYLNVIEQCIQEHKPKIIQSTGTAHKLY